MADVFSALRSSAHSCLDGSIRGPDLYLSGWSGLVKVGGIWLSVQAVVLYGAIDRDSVDAARFAVTLTYILATSYSTYHSLSPA